MTSQGIDRQRSILPPGPLSSQAAVLTTRRDRHDEIDRRLSLDRRVCHDATVRVSLRFYMKNSSPSLHWSEGRASGRRSIMNVANDQRGCGDDRLHHKLGMVHADGECANDLRCDDCGIRWWLALDAILTV